MPSAGKAQHQGTSREGFSCGQGYSLRSLRGKRAGAFYGSKAKEKRLASAKLLFRTAAGALFHATRMAFARCKCGCAAFLLFKAAASKLLLHKRGVLQMRQKGSFSQPFFCPVRAVFPPSAVVFFFKRFRSARRMPSNAKGVFSRAVRAVFAAAQKVRRFSF